MSTISENYPLPVRLRARDGRLLAARRAGDVPLMGPANRAPGMSIMGAAPSGLHSGVMGGPDTGPRVSVMGAGEGGTRVEVFGESDLRFVDSLFTTREI